MASNQFIKVYAWMVADLGLSGNDLILYAYLYGFFNINKLNNIHPSYDDIESHTGIGLKTAYRSLKRLAELGFIELDSKQKVRVEIRIKPHSEDHPDLGKKKDKMSDLKKDKMSGKKDKMSDKKDKMSDSYSRVLLEKDSIRSLNRSLTREEGGTDSSSFSSDSNQTETNAERISEACFEKFISIYPQPRRGDEDELKKLWKEIDIMRDFQKMMSLLSAKIEDGSWTENYSKYCPLARNFLQGRWWEKQNYQVHPLSDYSIESVKTELMTDNDWEKLRNQFNSEFNV